jgi:hypothetical protein
MELYGGKNINLLQNSEKSSITTELCEVNPKKLILTHYIHLYFYYKIQFVSCMQPHILFLFLKLL